MGARFAGDLKITSFGSSTAEAETLDVWCEDIGVTLMSMDPLFVTCRCVFSPKSRSRSPVDLERYTCLGSFFFFFSGDFFRPIFSKIKFVLLVTFKRIQLEMLGWFHCKDLFWTFPTVTIFL